MRLMELGSSRPKKAGKAILDFYPTSKDCANPVTRKKNVISIPGFVDLEMFPLESDWERFLIVSGGHNTSVDNAEVFFGGTDENPFLVRMEPSVMREYFLGGSYGFYRAIRPKRIEELGQTLCRSPRRQGDIFALHIGYTWEGLKRAAAIVGEVNIKVTDRKAASLFETRHLLTGQHARLNIGGATMQFASGTVVAPDHADLNLTKPYLIEQTEFLYNPPAAD